MISSIITKHWNWLCFVIVASTLVLWHRGQTQKNPTHPFQARTGGRRVRFFITCTQHTWGINRIMKVLEWTPFPDWLGQKDPSPSRDLDVWYILQISHYWHASNLGHNTKNFKHYDGGPTLNPVHVVVGVIYSNGFLFGARGAVQICPGGKFTHCKSANECLKANLWFASLPRRSLRMSHGNSQDQDEPSWVGGLGRKTSLLSVSATWWAL